MTKGCKKLSSLKYIDLKLGGYSTFIHNRFRQYLGRRIFPKILVGLGVRLVLQD